MLDKIDKIWLGFVFGCFFPAFCFSCYWLFRHSQLSFPNGFVRYLRAGDMLQEVAIICVVANLAIFYLSLNKKIFDFGRGLITATFLYVGLVLYISLL
ncbi:MAG: hypothetical protein V4580_09850 [Bacteroidota bacterium]